MALASGRSQFLWGETRGTEGSLEWGKRESLRAAGCEGERRSVGAGKLGEDSSRGSCALGWGKAPSEKVSCVGGLLP